MRKIKRIPTFFSDYIKKNKPNVWADLKPEIRVQLRNHIKENEQQQVDAYTQQKLIADAEHIDHFKKKSFISATVF